MNIRGLETLGKSQDSYGDLLVPILLEKLPIEIRRTIARNYGNHQWTLTDLRAAIQSEIRVLQESHITSYTEHHQPTASFHIGSVDSSVGNQLGTRSKNQKENQEKKRYEGIQGRTERKKLCPFCSGEHVPNECTSIQTVVKRRECVRRKKLCFNCLGGSHLSSMCKSRFRCRHCKGKHHTSICEQGSQALNSDPTARLFTPNATTNVQGTAMLHSVMQTRSNVLLKTAIAEVSSTEYTTDAHILFDVGSQGSFISQKLADDLHLQPSGTENVSIASFGAEGLDVRRVETATVHLKTDRGEQIPIDVLIVPTIAVPLPNFQQEVKSMSHLRGLKLAHPVTEDYKFEITLLIGADSYWRIVGNRVIRGNGPTTIQSKIGYLLSGPLSPSTPSSSNKHILSVVTSSPRIVGLKRSWKTLESINTTPEANSTADSVNTNTSSYIDRCISTDEDISTTKLPRKYHNETFQALASIATETETFINDHPLTCDTCEIDAEPFTPLLYGRWVTKLQYSGNAEMLTIDGSSRADVDQEEADGRLSCTFPLETRITHCTTRTTWKIGQQPADHTRGRCGTGPRRSAEGDVEAGHDPGTISGERWTGACERPGSGHSRERRPSCTRRIMDTFAARRMSGNVLLRAVS